MGTHQKMRLQARQFIRILDSKQRYARINMNRPSQEDRTCILPTLKQFSWCQRDFQREVVFEVIMSAVRGKGADPWSFSDHVRNSKQMEKQTEIEQSPLLADHSPNPQDVR